MIVRAFKTSILFILFFVIIPFFVSKVKHPVMMLTLSFIVAFIYSLLYQYRDKLIENQEAETSDKIKKVVENHNKKHWEDSILDN